MAEIVRMPKLSDTMTEGVVAEWHKKVGDSIESGELLAEIETDKATMEFESFQEGVLLHIGVEQGQTAPVDSILAILGEQGAEQLLGKGDMLYMSSANRIVRIHAPFVSDGEIEKINNSLRSQAEPDYVDEILNFADEKEIGDNQNQGEKDELYEQALDIIRSEGKASTSFLQRKLQIGYNRAARIIDMMEADGVVSKANHVGKRDVL